jgi:hypothetical protein
VPLERIPLFTNRLQCAACGRVSRENERGWRAYVTDDEDEPTVVVVYCRRCALKEFGR